MSETRQNMIVGTFVLLGLATLALLIMMFGPSAAWSLREAPYSLNIQFDTATGIRAGTQVTIGGIVVGRVDDVGFVDPKSFSRGVHVAVSFDEGVRLRAGSRAETTEPGIGAGRPPIAIIPGPENAALLPSGEVIYGEMTTAIESLIPPSIVATFERTATQIGNAAEALSPVLDDLHGVMQPRSVAAVDRPGGPQGNMSTAIARLDESLRHFNDLIGDPATQTNFKTALENLSTMTEDGKVVMADLRTAAGDAKDVVGQARTLATNATTTLETIDGNVDRVSRALIGDLETAGSFLDKLNTVAGQIQRGEGTIGRIVSDERLYEAMVLTFRRLAATTEEFRALVKDWQKGKIRVGL